MELANLLTAIKDVMPAVDFPVMSKYMNLITAPPTPNPPSSSPAITSPPPYPINSETCGYFPSTPPTPFACNTSSTCTTLSNIVGCVSSTTTSHLFSVCFDSSALQNGACGALGPLTGCCTESLFPECGTYLFPGTSDPPPSMLGCFTSATTITMIDVYRATGTVTTTETERETETETRVVTATRDGGGETLVSGTVSRSSLTRGPLQTAPPPVAPGAEGTPSGGHKLMVPTWGIATIITSGVIAAAVLGFLGWKYVLKIKGSVKVQPERHVDQEYHNHGRRHVNPLDDGWNPHAGEPNPPVRMETFRKK
ncbi:hypothetical protein OQA88_10787 [Cercophora sp. LCS_1]